MTTSATSTTTVPIPSAAEPVTTTPTPTTVTTTTTDPDTGEVVTTEDDRRPAQTTETTVAPDGKHDHAPEHGAATDELYDDDPGSDARSDPRWNRHRDSEPTLLPRQSLEHSRDRQRRLDKNSNRWIRQARVRVAEDRSTTEATRSTLPTTSPTRPTRCSRTAAAPPATAAAAGGSTTRTAAISRTAGRSTPGLTVNVTKWTDPGVQQHPAGRGPSGSRSAASSTAAPTRSARL